MKKHILMICCIFLLFVSWCYAEEGCISSPNNKSRSIANSNSTERGQLYNTKSFSGDFQPTFSDLFFTGVDNSVMDAAIGSSRSAFEINAMKDSSTALLRIGRDVSKSLTPKIAEYSSWSITFSVPVNKNSDSTDLATLDGLANSFKLSVKASNFLVSGKRRPFDPKTKLPPQRFIEICQLAGLDFAKDGCESGEVYNGLEKKGKLEYYPEFKSFFWNSNAWKFVYGIEGAVGYENFEFISKQTFEKQDRDKTPWSASGFVGAVPPGYNAVLTIGGQFQDAYKATKTQTVCPVTTGTSVICNSGALGEPDHQQKYILYIEGRTELLSLGINVRISHDFKRDDTGVDVPIYIFRDKKNSLNGGIRIGWIDKMHKTVLGLFIGGNYSLF